MIEDRSYELLEENHLLSSTRNNVIASNDYDFNKYDPYIEKIRTLFVPSLEPRIYSCLETFVYREASGPQSEFPYLKRCLDVAAAWRDPVEAFCTKWREAGFLEKMLTNAIKFLITDGLIDCFLNSIILNNRLNKVCRNLDSLGVEKDLSRYLAVWNYVNEKDYWLEDDKKISTSKSDQSYDSIDHQSDLDVEVGSGLGDRALKRAFKRRATDDSSEDPNKSGSASQNVHKNEEIGGRFPSRLSIDSSNPEGSRSSSARKKIRSCQAYPCRPSTCPSYRMKNSAPANWEGKTLKLQLCKVSPETSECGREFGKSLRLSKLPLPCKFDDLIAEIVKADSTSSGSFLIQRRKKFQAAVTSVCCRVNEILGKIDRKEVRRCRLHCEILPGCVSFRLIERELDGCKVCLFSDRVVIDRIDQPKILGSSGNKLTQIREGKNSEEADLTIFKNTGFVPADDESRIIRSFEDEATIKTEPLEILLRLSDDNLEATVRKNLEKFEQLSRKEILSHSSENKIEDLTCGCNTSFDHPIDYGTENNDKNSLELRNHSKELIRKESINRSNGNAIADEKCYCNNSVDDKPDQAAKNEENTKTISQRKLEELPRSVNCSNENVIESQKCACNTFFYDTFDNLDRAIEANNDVQPSNHQVSGISDLMTISHENEEISNSLLEAAAEKDEILKLQQDFSIRSSSAIEKNLSNVVKDNQLDNIACACPSDCTCPNKCTEENLPEECDSQCSCNSCGQPDETVSFKKTEIIRMSSLVIEDKPAHFETLDSGIQDSLNPPLTEMKEVSVSASDELRCNCLEVKANSSHSQNLEILKGTSTQSDISLESNVTKVISFIEADSKQNQPDLSPVIQPGSSAINKSSKKLSIDEHPVVSARLSRPKGQRINISIEVCPESESSKEHLLKSECKDIINPPLYNKFEGHKDVSLVRKSRGHPVDLQASGKQVLPRADKNTKDEWLRHLRGIDARVHSSPRPLESRDYLPPFEPPSSMRNPIVYGMSTKSGIRSIGKFDGGSMSQEKRQRGGKTSYETMEIRKSTKNRCGSIERKERANRREDVTKRIPRISTKPQSFSPFAIHNNVCHAFSASSVDRMKHLIKTKLRRILLERDKATNTPKTINKKYRLTTKEGKSDRSSFRQQRCRTIWESRSASDSVHTTRSFVSNDRTSSVGLFEKDEGNKLFYSTANPRILSNETQSFGRRYRDFDSMDNAGSYYLKNNVTSSRNSEIGRPSVGKDRLPDMDLNVNYRRLAGGSDVSYLKDINGEIHSKKERKKTTKECVKIKNRDASENKKSKFEGKMINHSCKEDSEETGDSATNSRKVSGKKILDELAECSGRLDCSGNSTSRHIYLYEFDRLESSNDEIESPFCDRKDSYSPSKIHSSEVEKISRKARRVYPKKLSDSRARDSRFPRESSVPRDIAAISNFSSKINTVTTNTIRRKGFSNLDRDLRTKLSEYVSLCKSVKYSLLKRLRPDDIYEVSRTSIPCCDRYNFGDS